MRSSAFASCLAAILLLSASTARATIIEALDLRELVRGSDHVVIGTVVSIRVRYDHLGRIVTDASVRIEESMHGAAANGSTIIARSLGGEIGDVGLRVEGEPSWIAGERILLFARALPAEGVVRAVGMSQGVLPIRTIDGTDRAMPGASGLALMQRGSDGRLRPAPAALLEAAPLDELCAQIRELVTEIHGAR